MGALGKQAARRRSRPSRRVVELMVAITVAGVVLLVAGPYLYRLWKREQLRIAVSEIYAFVAASRLHAVKHDRLVVVFVDLKGRRIMSWADSPPYDLVQEPGEPTLQQLPLPPSLFFRYAPNGDAVDDADAVCFDGYNGDRDLVDRIVFQPDGTLLFPQALNSRQPLRPRTYTAAVPYGSIDCNPGNRCRGIYIADRPEAGATSNRNAFRISVDDFGRSGRISLLKWLPLSEGGNRGETNYVPPPWRWVD